MRGRQTLLVGEDGPGWLTDPAWVRAAEYPQRLAPVSPLLWATRDGEVVGVPERYAIDGASIPRVLWSLGHPFEPWVLRSAAVHDWLCQQRDARGSRWVHAQFADGLRCDARTRWEHVKARVYATAVALFGPRWAAGDAP
jgi:hypothetical protein